MVGASVQQCAPQSRLWAPSYRELEDVANARLPLDLVLQCSWAESRRKGPSTRINRDLVDTYYFVARQSDSLSSIRFVLLGEERSRLTLFSIGIGDLQELVDAQRRGTVGADTLHTLRHQPSGTRPWEPCAETLHKTLLQLEHEGSQLGSSSDDVGRLTTPPNQHSTFSRRFFNRPTPLAVAAARG